MSRFDEVFWEPWPGTKCPNCGEATSPHFVALKDMPESDVSKAIRGSFKIEPLEEDEG